MRFLQKMSIRIPNLVQNRFSRPRPADSAALHPPKPPRNRAS